MFQKLPREVPKVNRVAVPIFFLVCFLSSPLYCEAEESATSPSEESGLSSSEESETTPSEESASNELDTSRTPLMMGIGLLVGPYITVIVTALVSNAAADRPILTSNRTWATFIPVVGPPITATTLFVEEGSDLMSIPSGVTFWIKGLAQAVGLGLLITGLVRRSRAKQQTSEATTRRSLFQIGVLPSDPEGRLGLTVQGVF